MIIRNAILSEQGRLIGRVGRASRGDAAIAQARQGSAIESAPSSAPVVCEPRLSFEAVAAWLAIQDSETRTACASLLADELIQVHELAKTDGFAAGESQGRKEAVRANESLRTALLAISEAAETAFDEEKLRLGELCVEIVAEAFGKIAGSLLATREAACGAVIAVLKRVKEGRELTIRVSPADLSVLTQEESKLAAVLPGRKFSLLADGRVDIGGCIVESQLGSLDGRLEIQLRELYATLRAAKSAAGETP